MCVMVVWVMAEATCEVAVLCCYDAASIHINVQGLCTRLQVLFIAMVFECYFFNQLLHCTYVWLK